jgi:Uncharacterized protein conserved in bacteria (DUF2330)
MLGWWMIAVPSEACGGFFCSNGGVTTYTSSAGYTVPVVQSSERILFRVNGAEKTITTFVEVGYVQSEDVDFAWIIPIPEPIDPKAVATASADLFNGLERATAPSFTFTWPVVVQTGGYGYGYGGYGYGNGRGSSCGCPASSSSAAETGTFNTTSGATTTAVEEVAVVVVAEAVVGPFAIEVITASDAEAFAEWLTLNGYDLPEGAVAPLQHYVDLGMAYLGVKLAPEVPTGPIDTLQFTYPGTEPMIPIILTSIASAAELPIQAWVLADQPFSPNNWEVLRDVAPEVQPSCDGGADYLTRVGEAIDAFDGLAFELEYAQTTDLTQPLGALVRERAWLARWRGALAPQEMVLDPGFAPDEKLVAYSNVHVIDLPADPCANRGVASRRITYAGAAPMLFSVAWWGRRSRRTQRRR